MKNRENFTELNETELEDKYRHFKEELFNLRFQVVTGQLANPSRISLVKKNIARVRTQINKIQKGRVREQLKAEYTTMITSKGIDPMRVPLKDRLSMLKAQLSTKAQKVRREIRSELDGKMSELLKSIRHQISEKLKKDNGGKEETALRAASKRLRDPKFQVRKKFLDKLSGMGLNEASQIKSLKDAKRAKLSDLEMIRTLQLELTFSRLPF
ncbi:MAG: 50S ribosomal protein L29 [Candidatus Riflebacteria bacterium]|nr:50S ribosomal protein L29 [Candidatus Riflebacteria bacterium]